MQMERSDISAEMAYNSLSLYKKKKKTLAAFIWKKAPIQTIQQAKPKN